MRLAKMAAVTKVMAENAAVRRAAAQARRGEEAVADAGAAATSSMHFEPVTALIPPAAVPANPVVQSVHASMTTTAGM